MRLMYPYNDGVVVVEAAPKSKLEKLLGPMTENNYLAHVVGRSLPPGVKQVYVLADDWKPPEFRHFRNAWIIDPEGQITIDMARARDLQRDHIRGEREALFPRLDNAAMQALEKDDKAALAEVTKQKNKLRDAPAHPAIEQAETPEELAAITLISLL